MVLIRLIGISLRSWRQRRTGLFIVELNPRGVLRKVAPRGVAPGGVWKSYSPPFPFLSPPAQSLTTSDHKEREGGRNGRKTDFRQFLYSMYTESHPPHPGNFSESSSPSPSRGLLQS